MNAIVEPATATPANGRRRRILLLIAAVFIVIAAVWALYWTLVLSKRERTDDAYVNGNKVVISAQVSGTVVAVLTDDTQLVHAGDVLVRLDPVDAQVSLSHASSALAQAVRQVRQQKATARQYDASVASRKIELGRALIDLKKREPLVADSAIAPEEVRHARESVELAKAALTEAIRQAGASHALVDCDSVENNPTVLEAKAAFRDAWIAARRNAVIAPVSGYVAERSVQLGQHIEAGQALMTVIPLNTLWVDANFKEVQLRNVRIGQPAQVRSDLYGGSFIFHGHVSGMSAGTGAAFALLPAQNASGNWIKVVQRVPVRIEIDDGDLTKSPLRVGLSATVTVDTTDRNGAVLAGKSADKPVGETQVYTRDLEQANAEADAVVRRNLAAARRAASVPHGRDRDRGVHGNTRHDHCQCFRAGHFRESRRQQFRGYLGDQLVHADRRGRAAPVRLDRPALRRGENVRHLRMPVHAVLRDLRFRHQPADAGRRPADPRPGVGPDDVRGAGHPAAQLSARAARHGDRAVQHGDHRRTDRRTHLGGLDHGQSVVALAVLHQSSGGHLLRHGNLGALAASGDADHALARRRRGTSVAARRGREPAIHARQRQ
jgi:membrane fusion protein (multidrug efflux system)